MYFHFKLSLKLVHLFYEFYFKSAAILDVLQLQQFLTTLNGIVMVEDMDKIR